MHIYRIGYPEGQQRVGYSRDADALLNEMTQHSPPGLRMRKWDVDTGRAMLVIRMFYLKNQSKLQNNDWVLLSDKEVDEVIDDALRQVTPQAIAGLSVASRTNMASMMLHLRLVVFCTTQEVMGEIAGRTAPIISRWEAGTGVPGLEELSRIRAAAVALGLPWDDAHVLDASTFSHS